MKIVESAHCKTIFRLLRSRVLPEHNIVFINGKGWFRFGNHPFLYSLFAIKHSEDSAKDAAFTFVLASSLWSRGENSAGKAAEWK